MRKLLKKLNHHFLLTPRERYLSEASDLADLEFRQRAWDKAALDRSNYYQYFGL